MLKTSSRVGNVRAADILREQFAIRTHVSREADVWLDVSNAGNLCDVLDACVVENTSGISVRALASVGVLGAV